MYTQELMTHSSENVLKGWFSSGWKPIIRLDKVYYFTRGCKVGLRKIGPETAKISRNIHPNKAWGSPSLSRTNCNSRSNLPTDTVTSSLVSEPQSTGDMPCSPGRTYTVCLRLDCTVHCNTRSTQCCIQYSDKLPMKTTCNC